MDSIFDKTREFVKKSFNKSDAQMKHFDRTAYWLRKLKPDADEAYLIAAVGHDIERAFGYVFADTDKSFKDEESLRKHSEDGAVILGKFLEKEGVDQEIIKRVKHMVAKHETGGDDDQNFLKDADSLSFLENNAPIFLLKIDKLGYDKVREKFEWMYERISSEKARKIARPFYDRMMKELDKYKINNKI